MNKKLLIGLLIGLFLAGGITILAAPASNILRNILPESTTTYEIGSSTPAALWLRIYTQNASTSALTISGLGNTGTDCLQLNNQGVVDNSGGACGGGGAGFGKTWELNTDLVSISPTTTVGVLLTASSTFDRLFARYATTTQATTTTLGVTGLVRAASIQSTGSLEILGSTGFSFSLNDTFTSQLIGLTSAAINQFSIDSSGFSAILDVSQMNVANRTFRFPDWSGDFIIGTTTLNYANFNATSSTATSTLLDLRFTDAQGTSLSLSGNTVAISATTTNLTASNDMKVATTTLNQAGGWGFGIGTTTVISGAQIVNTMSSTTCGGTCTVNWNSSTKQFFTLTGNSTFIINGTSSNPINGGAYLFGACQDDTGSRTVTLASGLMNFGSLGTTTFTSTANRCTAIGMIYVGSIQKYMVMGSTTSLFAR